MKQLVVLALCAALVWTFLKVFPNDDAADRSANEETRSQQELPADTERAAHAAPPALPTIDPEPVEIPPATEDVTADTERAAEGSGLFGAPLEDTSAADNPFAVPKEASPSGPPALALELGGHLTYGRNADARELATRRRGELPAGLADTVIAFVDAIEGRAEAAREIGNRLHAEGLLDQHAGACLRGVLGLAPLPDAGPEDLARMDPVERGMQYALWREAARRSASRGPAAEAAGYWTDLLVPLVGDDELFEAGGFGAWMDELRDVQRDHRWSPRGEWPHFELLVESGDSLIAVRKRALREDPTLELSTGLIARANDLRGDTIHPGDTLRIPTDPVRVLVDLDSRWLLYLHGGEVVDGWEVGVGRPGEETITGRFYVGLKQVEPMYFGVNPPVPYGAEGNPLGTRWIAWRNEPDSSDLSYGFHGTWEPESVGEAMSEGCVRMLNERVEFLFEVLPQQAMVTVRG